MPLLSRQAIEWIEDLHRPRRLGEAWTGGLERRAECIHGLGCCGEVDAVPYLLPFLLHSALETRAAMAIQQLMDGATHEEFIDLYQGRSTPSPLAAPKIDTGFLQDWFSLSPERVSEFQWLGPASVWVLGLASFHGNGHVRQAAVEGLGRREEPEAVPFLLLRVNDWVSQVRSRALKSLDARLDAGRTEQFARALDYLRRLGRGGRADHGPFIAKVRAALLAEPQLTAIREAVATENRDVRREAFDLAWRREDAVVSDLLDLALDDEDVVVRIRGARRALNTDDPSRFLDRIRKDPASSVRKLYVDFVGDDQGRCPELLVPFLVDGHGGVRADTRFYLRKHGWERSDFLAHYMEGLEVEEDGALGPYLRGVGEVGSAEDAVAVRPYLAADLPRLRRAAITALGQLSPKLENQRLRDELLAALKDPYASVSKAARDAIVQNRLSVPAERLHRIAVGAEHPHTLRIAAQLLHTTGKWTSIVAILGLVREVDGEERDLVLGHADRWLRRGARSFVTPTPEEARDLRRAVEESAGSLGERGEKILTRLADAGG